MDVHGPWSDLASRIPRERDQLTSRERPAGVAGKGGEELEFPGSQVHGPPVMSKATSSDVEIEAVGDWQVGPSRELRVAAVSTGC